MAGEVKILVSGDGSNFEEAACWKRNQRQDVAFSETILFHKPTHVKAMALVDFIRVYWQLQVMFYELDLNESYY